MRELLHIELVTHDSITFLIDYIKQTPEKFIFDKRIVEIIIESLKCIKNFVRLHSYIGTLSSEQSAEIIINNRKTINHLIDTIWDGNHESKVNTSSDSINTRTVIFMKMIKVIENLLKERITLIKKYLDQIEELSQCVLEQVYWNQTLKNAVVFHYEILKFIANIESRIEESASKNSH